MTNLQTFYQPFRLRGVQLTMTPSNGALYQAKKHSQPIPAKALVDWGIYLYLQIFTKIPTSLQPVPVWFSSWVFSRHDGRHDRQPTHVNAPVPNLF